MVFITSAVRGQAHRHRVLRGGSWNNNDNNMQCANRNRNNPDNRNNNIGFRVVASTFFETIVVVAGNVWRVSPSRPRQKMAEPVPGRLQLFADCGELERANSNGPAPWVRPWCGAPFEFCHVPV